MHLWGEKKNRCLFEDSVKWTLCDPQATQKKVAQDNVMLLLLQFKKKKKKLIKVTDVEKVGTVREV